jgi:DHA3 family macrolide efflux protein-like MFS transporter
MEKKDKLWTRSFLILWQGQLVSTMGDAVYSIALGFWVLAVTGSTALMGTLMAASTLPGVLVSPFAGVLIDRSHKRRLFILMDLLRGVCVVLLATAAFRGMLQIWMAFAAGILLSVCGAVFNPGLLSAVPDLVAEDKIPNANAAFSIVTTGSNLIGSVAGGFLFQVLGAPALFLFDGLSFLFSGATLPFVKIPDSRKNEKTHFFADMREGFHYIGHKPGLRAILPVAALCNFCVFTGIVLMPALCNASPSLGASGYGVMMGGYMGGAMVGYMLMSAVTLKPGQKAPAFVISSVICSLTMIAGASQSLLPLMTVLFAVSGAANSVFNTLIIAAIQSSTPQEVRGKVMSFLLMVTQGLTPFAMALGGVLGGIFPIRAVIVAAFTVEFFVILPSYFIPEARAFIVGTEEPETDKRAEA